MDLGTPSGSGPALRHPHVVVQNDLFNRSGLATTVVCTITSNLRRAAYPGTVTLEAGEANLPRQSVVNTTQVATVDKDELTEKIGKVSDLRLREILAGIDLLLEPRDLET